MSETFTLLSHRTLPSEHHLSHYACCPTMDLAVLAASSTVHIGSSIAPDPRKPSYDTLTCFRLSGSTPQVWSIPVNKFFLENCICVDLGRCQVELDPGSRFDEITALHWSPDGQCLVAGLASQSPSRSPTFIILSVHSGQLLAFPTVITSSGFSDDHQASSTAQATKLDFVTWMSLDSSPSEAPPFQEKAEHKPRAESVGQSLCDRLPTNLIALPMTNIETIRKHMGPVDIPNGAQGETKSQDHYPMVRLPPSLFTNRHETKRQPHASSLLVVSSHGNMLHFFINGTVHLGTTSLPKQVRLAGVQLVEYDAPESEESPASHRGGVCVQLVWFNAKNELEHGTLELQPTLLPLSPSPNKPSLHLNIFKAKPKLSVLGVGSKELNEQIQLSHSIQALLKDCFFGYFSMIKEWQVSRACGMKWYASFEEVSKTHNGMAPLSFQMLQLLFVGQATEGLRDFLGTKNADRIFTKWESTVVGCLSRIRLALVEMLVPDIERLYVLVTELRTHCYPELSSVKIIDDEDFEVLLLVESLLKSLLREFHGLDKAVREEDERFRHFCKWLRSEFDHVVALENVANPPGRPPIKYDLMTVSKFIARGDANPLDKALLPPFSPTPDDILRLEEEKQKLARSYYDELFDIDGPPKRSDAKKKLSELLSFPEFKSRDEPMTEPKTESLATSPVVHNFVTPDTSHFHMEPNLEFQTPTLGDHFKRQNEAVVTPSNVHAVKPQAPSTSASVFQYPSNFSVQPSEAAEDVGGGAQQRFGIYASLTHTSAYIAQVFMKMFNRIGTARPIQPHPLRPNSRDSITRPPNLDFCSRFVGEYHYCAYLAARDPEQQQQMVINRIKLNPSISSAADLEESSQVTFEITHSTNRVAGQIDSEDHQNIKVLDFDFFDDSELVLLTQRGVGFDTKYQMITLKYSDYDELLLTRNFDHLNVYRCHELQSDYAPERMSLNGFKGRRTGCVISGAGRMLHVFDMEDMAASDDGSNASMAEA